MPNQDEQLRNLLQERAELTEQLKAKDIRLGSYEANALLAKELLQPESNDNPLGYPASTDPETLIEHMDRAFRLLNKINEPENN